MGDGRGPEAAGHVLRQVLALLLTRSSIAFKGLRILRASPAARPLAGQSKNNGVAFFAKRRFPKEGEGYARAFR